MQSNNKQQTTKTVMKIYKTIVVAGLICLSSLGSAMADVDTCTATTINNSSGSNPTFCDDNYCCYLVYNPDLSNCSDTGTNTDYSCTDSMVTGADVYYTCNGVTCSPYNGSFASGNGPCSCASPAAGAPGSGQTAHATLYDCGG